MPRSDEAKRKIYFFRVVPDQIPGDGWTFDRKAVVDSIRQHVGQDTFYLDEGDDRITCAEVVSAVAPQAIKLYSIRRSNLPARDSGGGVIGDLGFKVDEGLAEAVHLRLFPNGVIGFESFFYGPRIMRFESYLRERCGMDVSIRELYRGDVLERALKFQDIRTLRLKIHPAHVTNQAATDTGIRGLMSLVDTFDAAVYADVTLRSDRGDQGFTGKAKGLIQGFRQNAEDPATVFEALEIQGVNPESGKVEALNLLNDALQRQVSIPRASARTRALDSEAAFKAIRTAYKDVKADLPNDAYAG